MGNNSSHCSLYVVPIVGSPYSHIQMRSSIPSTVDVVITPVAKQDTSYMAVKGKALFLFAGTTKQGTPRIVPGMDFPVTDTVEVMASSNHYLQNRSGQRLWINTQAHSKYQISIRYTNTTTQSMASTTFSGVMVPVVMNGTSKQHICIRTKAPAECFPSTATCVLFDPKTGVTCRKTLKDLHSGETVLSGDGFPTRVIGFTHRDVDSLSDCIRVTCLHGHTLIATPGHLVPLIGKEEDFVPMNRLQIGDICIIWGPLGEYVGNLPIVALQATSVTGRIAPLTASGTMLVDGFSVSCYTTHLNRKVAETGTWLLTKLEHVVPGSANCLLSVLRRLCESSRHTLDT